MLGDIQAIYGIEEELTESRAIDLVRASVLTNLRLYELLSVLRESPTHRQAQIPPGSADPTMPSPSSTILDDIPIDTPAEAIQSLVEENKMRRIDAERLVPILLGLRLETGRTHASKATIRARAAPAISTSSFGLPNRSGNSESSATDRDRSSSSSSTMYPFILPSRLHQ